MKELIERLCMAHGSSGEEHAAAQLAQKEFSRYCDVQIDHNGNVIASLGNPRATKHIMLDAHLDQIGMVITSINEEGFIKIASCGGMDRRVLPGSPVVLCGKEEISGVVCCMPPHLSEGGEDKAPAIDQIYIDTGLPASAIQKILQPGDRVLFQSSMKFLLGKRVSSPALDNRAGVAALIRCAQLLSEQEEELPCRVSFVCSVQEETGGAGAKTAAFTLYPDEAIVVDVSFAEQPGVPVEKSAKLGKGTMIGVSPSLSSDIYRTLTQLAEEHKIPYQMEIMGGMTGTNVDEITTAREGVPGGLTSIPLRYMHTQAEIIDLEDIESTARLLALYVQKGGVSRA